MMKLPLFFMATHAIFVPDNSSPSTGTFCRPSFLRNGYALGLTAEGADLMKVWWGFIR